jgi:serine/threonine protein kinase
MVAVKRITKDVDKPGTQRMFFRELTILVSIRHPSILPIVGYTLPDRPDPGGVYTILTEFMPNGNLQKWEDQEAQGVPNPGFDATCKSKVVFGLAVAMAHLHSRHVVHRDLKSENVFLDGNWEPRLADFGLSKVIDRVLLMSGMMGTPYFMAPELFDQSPAGSGYPIDVYAFAVIVLSLFTRGEFKFKGKLVTGFPQLMQFIGKGDRFDVPQAVKPCYGQLIDACWRSVPSERPLSAEIVQILQDDDFYIDGTNLPEFNAYRQRLSAWRPEASGEGQDAPETPPSAPFAWS